MPADLDIIIPVYNEGTAIFPALQAAGARHEDALSCADLL